MKILCKVKPEYDTCCTCIDENTDKKIVADCEKCKSRIPVYEVLQFGHGFWEGDWAMVLTDDGTVEKVELDRLFNVYTIMES